MIFRQLTPDGDFTFGRGTAGFARGQAAIALDIACFIRSWKNGSFWNLQYGIDWFSRLDKGQKRNLEAEIATGLGQRFGVLRVTQVSAAYDPDARGVAVAYAVDTIYGSFASEIALAVGAAPSA